MNLERFGRIKRITIPEAWLEEGNPDEFSEMTTYVHPEAKDVKLSFYYRGKPISSRSAENFGRVISKAPHVLDDVERESVEVVMRDASEPEYFDFKKVYTGELNGVVVLFVEGFWKLSDVDSLGIFVVSEEDGSRIDEIYYLAPPDLFQEYLPIIRQALQSIEWEA